MHTTPHQKLHADQFSTPKAKASVFQPTCLMKQTQILRAWLNVKSPKLTQIDYSLKFKKNILNYTSKAEE